MAGTGWQALALIAATLMINWVVGWYLRMRRNDALKQRQQAAEKVLRAHGMEAPLPVFDRSRGWRAARRPVHL